MSQTANRRTGMTLFSDKDELYSHIVRIVLAEKGVAHDLVLVKPEQVPEDVYEVNPYGSLPTLIDRELSVFKAPIINEYLDERFPHPPLMPVYPVARANTRLMMYRIEQDWFSLAKKILSHSDDAAVARRDLREGLLAMAPLFQENTFFLSDEFSLLDCYLAALLWRLPAMGIELSGAGSKALNLYMGRIFERDGFQQSLTSAEREIRRG